jgi:hypothetical protein
MEEKTAKIGSLTDNVEQSPNVHSDISSNIIIRNLPYHTGENLRRKVSDLISSDLGLPDISVIRVERKDELSNGNPGVVVANIGSSEDRLKVMKNKIKLKDSARYSKVYIHNDQHKSDRQLAANMRTIVRAINSGQKNWKLKASMWLLAV